MPTGTIIDGILYKRGKQVHLFRLYDGFSLDDSALKTVNSVVVYFQNKRYEATVEQIHKYGVPYKHPSFEPQTVLARKYWKTTDVV